MADGTGPKSIWDSDETAARYAAFTSEFPMYSETSRDLVRLAAPAPDAAVVDLCCGTGATSKEILAALGPDGKVTGVDRSAAMLAVAARSVTDPRASWVRASAEEFHQVLPGPAEAVVCNSAIWQTDFVSTVQAARAVLAAGGVFAFNFGDEFLRPEDGAPRRDGELPLMTTMREIAADEYDWSPPADATRRRPRLSQHEVSEILVSAGFAVRHTWLEYEQSPESQQAWLRVPSFTDRQLPGLPYEARMAVLDEAFRRIGPPGTEVSRWLAVTATSG
jgi:ubiquinone/menaquinone biosynthesis C-methylase UbiE